MKQTSQLLVEPYFEYKDFLETCRNKIYNPDLVLHTHHIIPKCLGGDNSNNNLIRLSVEDHTKAHLLFSKCFDNGSYEEIANLRSSRILNKFSIKDFEDLDRIRDAYVGENNPFYNKTHTLETKQKISRATTDILSGVSYEERYGDRATEQKEIRSFGVKAVWDSRTVEEKAAIAKKAVDTRRKNGNGGHGIRVSINGIEFKSMSNAAAHFGVSTYYLSKDFEIIFLGK